MVGMPRGPRWRRVAARGCAVGAVVCLGLAGIGTAAAQEDPGPPLPDVFRSSATAQMASAFLDREALLPVNEAFRFIALDGAGIYESSNQTARASIFYPGNGVISGPTLACDTFGGQVPPELAPIIEACTQFDYPLTVFADSLSPDGTSAGAADLGNPSDPVSVRAVRAVAHAAIDASTTDAAVSDLRIAGLPAVGSVPLPVPGAPELDPTIIAVEGALTTTDQRIDETGTLVARSEAALAGVRLVGGLVEIDSIRSTSRVTDDGHGTKERASSLHVGGVTVGGLPAEITEDGLVVGSPTGVDGPLVQQLTRAVNDLLRGLGIRITTLAVEDGVDDSGMAFARSGGVLIEFDLDVQGLPILPGPIGDIDPNGIYKGVILLGETGVTGFASTIDNPAFTPGGDLDLPDLDIGAVPVASGSSAARPPAPSPVVGLDDVPAERIGSTGSSSSGAGRQRVASLSEALAASRIALAYLAFTLMAFGVCIGPRFILPARLPGGAP